MARATLSRRDALLAALAATAAGAGGRFFDAFAQDAQVQDADAVWSDFQAALEREPWTLGVRSVAERAFDAPLELIEGRAPAGLAGVLHRNGPALFDRAGWRYGHWFDGDGLVQAWSIGPDGAARHSARFVATKKFLDEEAAGRFLVPAFGSVPSDARPAKSADAMNVANTSVLPLAGALYALWEGGSAYELDPETLLTKGAKTWGEGLQGLPFSAHPRVDPVSGEVWNFGSDPFNGQLVIYRIGADGALTSARPLRIEGVTIVHDFVVTERKLLIVASSIRRIEADTLSVLGHFAPAKDQALVVHAFDKDDLAPAGRWSFEPGFAFHFGDGWEEADGAIRFDAALYRSANFLFQGARDLMRGRTPTDDQPEPSLITLHPDGRGEIERGGVVGEFPQIDRRFAGRPRRFVFHIADRRSDGFGERAWARKDWRTGAIDRFDFGDEVLVEEPVFVPRGEREGDGWLIGTVLNLKAERTELIVLDAKRLGDGPVVRWAAPYALPLGFHGAWSRAA